MNTTIAVPINDVFKPTFESRMDPYFTAQYTEGRAGRYRDKDLVRSMLATTRPIRKSFRVWSERF